MKNTILLTLVIAFAFLIPSQIKAQVAEGKNHAIVEFEATRNNVLYVNCGNPITIAISGVLADEIQLTCQDTSVHIRGTNGNYYVVPSKVAQIELIVKWGDKQMTKLFRAKRIPDPVAQLTRNSSGQMGAGEFKAQGGVSAMLYNFDFDARCKIMGYELTRISNASEREMSRNIGARYTENSRLIINKAHVGDIYLYENIKCNCAEGEPMRTINSMIFRIK